MILADINKKLLTIKILYASKSLLKDKSIVWLSQIARWIKNILAYAHTGIRDWLEIETREKFKQ